MNVKSYTEFEVIGRTRDDAAGEAMDKAARTVGLPYPGGVNLDKISQNGDENKYKFPTPHLSTGKYDFSFSGLKTAVINLIHNAEQKGQEIDIPVLCATLRKRVCDMLISNTLKAAEENGYTKIAIAGGVSANSGVRGIFEKTCAEKGYKLYSKYAETLLYKIPKSYRDEAKNGKIAIEEFYGETDEKTLEAIKNYREWAQKAADVKKQIQETRREITELAKQKFDTIVDKYSDITGLQESRQQHYVDMAEYMDEHGWVNSGKYYQAAITEEKNKKESLYNE